MTATLAYGLAASGKRVLIVDADLRRGTQQQIWDVYQQLGNNQSKAQASQPNVKREWKQLVGSGGVKTTR